MPKACENTPVSKHQRSCVACGAKGPKTGLQRIVRIAQGQLAFDPTGRVSGRGAYVCDSSCLRKAGPSRLGRALKTTIDTDAFELLLSQMQEHDAAEQEAFTKE